MKPLLLLYLTSNDDEQRVAVGPALAGLAERAGVSFECHYDRLALGRHFGGGDVADDDLPRSGGTPFGGGRHADHVRRLADRYSVVAVGDSGSPLWPAVADSGADVLAAGRGPADVYAAVAAHLSWTLPTRVYVVDARPQGRFGVVTAPYLAPRFLTGEPALGLEVGATTQACAAVRGLDVDEVVCLWTDPARTAAFPLPVARSEGEVGDDDYGAVTAAMAAQHGGWARGAFVGDPDLVASQLARIRARRLVPVYGRPTRAVLAAGGDALPGPAVTVLGRQYDDHDFFDLARAGRALQVVDPGPPFDAAAGVASLPSAADAPEPTDEELSSWARDGVVVTTLCLWAGMIREVDGIPRLADLALDVGLRAGLVITAETAGDPDVVTLLATPPARGGVLGRLEPVLGSTGWAVAAEHLLPPGTLTSELQAASSRFASWPDALRPKGWWPLLDTALDRHGRPPVAVRDGRPRVLFSPRETPSAADRQQATGAEPVRPTVDVRRAVGSVLRASGGMRMLRERRPFDDVRPAAFDARVASEVAAAGLSYMFTKASFGHPRVVWRSGEFVALPFTAGRWDGWSPFYTVGSVRDVQRAERRLSRGRGPGWLVSTVDSPLFALAGEVWEHGARLRELAAYVVGGGRSGRLVNVTPNVVARYARLLASGAHR